VAFPTGGSDSLDSPDLHDIAKNINHDIAAKYLIFINLFFNTYIRDHWGIENKLHWTLDVVFRAAENFKSQEK